MSRVSPEGWALPKGVIYDPARHRYRVRLYYKSRPVFLRYAFTYDEAMAAYEAGLKAQEDVRRGSHGAIKRGNYAEALRRNLV